MVRKHNSIHHPDITIEPVFGEIYPRIRFNGNSENYLTLNSSSFEKDKSQFSYWKFGSNAIKNYELSSQIIIMKSIFKRFSLNPTHIIFFLSNDHNVSYWHSLTKNWMLFVSLTILLQTMIFPNFRMYICGLLFCQLQNYFFECISWLSSNPLVLNKTTFCRNNSTTFWNIDIWVLNLSLEITHWELLMRKTKIPFYQGSWTSNNILRVILRKYNANLEHKRKINQIKSYIFIKCIYREIFSIYQRIK